MNKISRRTMISSPLCAIAMILSFADLMSPAVAAEIIRLKNGSIIRSDKKLVMNSLSGQPRGMGQIKAVKNIAPDPPCIARIENDWQVIFVPLAQQDVLDANKAVSFASLEPHTFKLKDLRKKEAGGGQILHELGSMAYVGDFDEYGKRRVTIATALKPRDVFQSITEIGPDHVIVESANLEWKLGLGLKSIPFETIEKLVRKKIKQDDPAARFALAFFYVQADYYELAFKELDSIAREFPDKDKVELVEQRRTVFMNDFGQKILRRLERRKRAGQHTLAESFAKELLKQPLGASIQQDVQKFLDVYQKSHQDIEHAKQLLADWQAKLHDVEHEKLLQSMRSEVNEQLDFETLPRLDSFIKSIDDTAYEPSQRLGLAYTGWVLGAANAVPDLDQAFRIWDARNTVLEYLRSDDPGRQNRLMIQLQSGENISPTMVLNLVAQLPPILDASDVRPGVAHLVETTAIEPVKYWVTLPAEYSPHRNYPMVIALRARNRLAEETLFYWAGDARTPDLGSQRGYIVIAPEYAEKGQAEYTFGAPAHKYVLDCLIDARKRFAVDSDRVYLAGHGMGADAAFDIGMAHSDEFAGVISFGGNAINYCVWTWENGSCTSWYVVGKGIFGGNRDSKSNSVLDRMMMKGNKFDLMLLEYVGRNGEDIFDEIYKCYDWMDLASHVRPAQPKEFKTKSLRKTDNRFFWVTANGLPRDYILPAPAGNVPSINPMAVDGRVTPGNTIYLPPTTENYSLRITPELVDFERIVEVMIGTKKKYHGYVKKDAAVLLEELQQRGDRKRLPLAVLNPQ